MWKSAAAMLAGVSTILVLPELPVARLMLGLALPLVFAALYWRHLRWLLFLPLGLICCWWAAGQHLAARLDPAYEGREVTLSGWVSSLPEIRGELTEFEFRVETLDGHEPGIGVPGLVRLSIQGALVGDLMKKGEKRLLEMEPSLSSDLLVAPHHGSNSSSTPPFVAAVSPRQVWFPVGYRNRWGFPKPEVQARYLAGAELADTAADGALCMRFRAGSRPLLSMRWRRDAARLWASH